MTTTPSLRPEPTTAGFRVGFVSDTGRVRERNEDAYALYLAYDGEPSRAPVDAFFAVADGMGGHEAGDVASRFIVDALQRALTVEEPGFPAEPAALGAWIEGLVRRINLELIELGAGSGQVRSMGSTLTLAVVWRRTIYLGHVGDSRCYRLRAGVLRQLTEDHSWVAEQQRAGLLSEAEAAGHPQRNWLTQCLGIDVEPEVFLLEHPVLDGDRYLLCSDGLHGQLADAELAAVLSGEAEPQAAARRLVEAANRSGGPDNITAIVVDARVEPVEVPPPPLPALADESFVATLPGLEIEIPEPPRHRSRRRRLRHPLGALMTLFVVVSVGAGAWLMNAARPAAPPAPAAADSVGPPVPLPVSPAPPAAAGETAPPVSPPEPVSPEPTAPAPLPQEEE